jgi:hypothetical protein
MYREERIIFPLSADEGFGSYCLHSNSLFLAEVLPYGQNKIPKISDIHFNASIRHPSGCHCSCPPRTVGLCGVATMPMRHGHLIVTIPVLHGAPEIHHVKSKRLKIEIVVAT